MNDALCQLIREAFAGVTLGDGVGLLEAQGIDDRENEATCAAYRAKDEKEDWSRIPLPELNHWQSSPSFFDAAGMRFHLPAYLIADLRGECAVDISIWLTHLTERNISMFALLSDQQRQAVRAYLSHLAQMEERAFLRSDVNHALAVYWTDPSTTHGPA